MPSVSGKIASARHSRMPSARAKWLAQGFFYSISVSLVFGRLMSFSAALAGLFSESAGFAFSLGGAAAAALSLLFFAFCLLAFHLIFKNRKVSRRNSALGYSLVVLAAVTALLPKSSGDARVLATSHVLCALSVTLFRLSFNAANRQFAVLGFVFGRRMKPSGYALSNALILLVPFAASVGFSFLELGSPVFKIPGGIDALFGIRIEFICLALELVSAAFLAANPFTSRRRGILLIYERIESMDSSDSRLPAMKRRIREMFVDGKCSHFVNEIIKSLIRVFYHMRTTGLENVNLDDLPAVFICNHGEELGPICGMTFIPVQVYPWVDARMCRSDLSFERMWKYTFGPKFRIKFLGRALTKLIAKAVTRLINGEEPLEVVRDNPREAMKLLHETKDCLMAGGNVLIFPEDPGKSNDKGTYQKGSTGAFFTGFAQIGKIFSSETGIDLNFFPVFISKGKRMLSIGEPVRYDSKAGNAKAEKERIAKELQDKMNAFA